MENPTTCPLCGQPLYTSECSCEIYQEQRDYDREQTLEEWARQAQEEFDKEMEDEMKAHAYDIMMEEFHKLK